MVTTSPGSSDVSSPLQSRMCWGFTKRLMCRRTAPVSSQCSGAALITPLESSGAARTLGAKSASDAPAQRSRSGVGTLPVIVVARATGCAGVSRGGIGSAVLAGEWTGLNSCTLVAVRKLLSGHSVALFELLLHPSCGDFRKPRAGVKEILKNPLTLTLRYP
jgi:hypothetical protein